MNWWTRFLHILTAWRNFRQPNCDRVDIRRPRLQNWTRLDVVEWGVMAGQAITENRLDRVSARGIGRGYPMQQGTSLRRTVSVINRDFPTWRTQIPRVHGDDWLTGHPGGLWGGYVDAHYDKRAVIWDIDGTVFVIAHLNSVNGTCFSLKHADVDEVLEGTSFTTGHNPAARVWTPWSHQHHHEQAMTVADYVGADGVLTSGPVAGSLLVLDARSASYARMMVEGGECAERAEALATYGARIVDRSGYGDVARDQDHTHTGRSPRPPSLLTQAGRQWGDTNLHRFDVALADLKAAS